MPTMPAQIAEDAENRRDADAPDSFPPEGTDEATLDPDARHELSEADRLKATREVIKSGD